MNVVSPETGAPLRPEANALVSDRGDRFPVVRGIPRFTAVEYADSFGEQWRRYRRVQLDSVTGRPHSRDRLLSGTGWGDLTGERVLEVGCGAGRFTEVLLDLGAEVVAVDASEAIDACRETIGDHPRATLVQADLFRLPFEPGGFDRVFCYGVLQHTPDPRAAFAKLVDNVRPGGLVAADVYRRHGHRISFAKDLWRPLTTRLPRPLLRRVVEWYVPKWLPVDTKLRDVPRIGRFLVLAIPCANYTGALDLTGEQLRAWAILDTFDALSPRYDNPQTLGDVRAWCNELVDVDVRYGGNGIVVNARRPG